VAGSCSDDSRPDHVHAVERPNERTRGAPRQGVGDEKASFPSPTHGQCCRSLEERCHLRRMSNDTRAAPNRVACPHRQGGWHVAAAELSPTRATPQNGSNLGPRSIPADAGGNVAPQPDARVRYLCMVARCLMFSIPVGDMLRSLRLRWDFWNCP
jgi:hypothetical protein